MPLPGRRHEDRHGEHVVDDKGRLIAFEITPVRLGDVRAAKAWFCLAGGAVLHCRYNLRQCWTTPLPDRARTQPVISNNRTRKRFDADAHKQRNFIERMYCCLKDLWRSAASPSPSRPCNGLATAMPGRRREERMYRI